MHTELAKWITEIGAEVRVRTQVLALDAHTQRIDDLLRIIAEREVATAKAKVVTPRRLPTDA